MSQITKTKFILITALFLLLPSVAGADYLGQKVNFFVDKDYDLYGREKVWATLIYITPKLYFYLEDDWWNDLDFQNQQKILNVLENLGCEFEDKIYPTLTSTFGSEWKPGIDGNLHITVLIHQIKKEAGGYFNSGDEYLRVQNPKSNEREMVYLNTEGIKTPLAKIFLAHEFQHLITFNQKERLFNASEEIWLNEARSEYVLTLLNYDSVYEGSNLQRRVRNFLDKPNDSLTEWQGESSDYGVLNLFTQYLVDHYGVQILIDSLKMRKNGIESLNEALSQRGFKEDFSQVFTNWTIAVLVNNCNLGERYCYKNENLRKFQVIPTTNFLPLFGKSLLQVTKFTKNWAGNWEKIIGGKGVLKFEFDGADEVDFKVPYVICDKLGKCSVNFLNLDKKQKGVFYISNFNEKYTSLTIIPSIQSKTSGFDGPESFYSFSWVAATLERTPEEETELIKQLLAQIEFLQKEIARVRAEIDAILVKKIEKAPISCQRIEKNLYYGMKNDSQVRCLQEFLKLQGPEIYPEGLVTGNFLDLTLKAVIRFQGKYAQEILYPLNLKLGTGYVGPKTIAKINEMLSASH